MKVSYLIHLNGIVQGVGMRPFIYKTAKRLGIKGRVRNTTDGVEIIVTASPEEVERFLSEIVGGAPAVSKILEVRKDEIEYVSFEDFSIEHSSDSNDVITSISPDLALCEDCKRELIDKKDRRYLYPFINCTNCGPRYSIVLKIPYDRPNTTMKKFTMCPLCAKEYSDPDNRRFHAQPDACKDCGPDVTLILGSGEEVAKGYSAIVHTKRLIREGRVVCVKGLGGFHIACDARNDGAVRILRERKRRNMKPFAVMVPDISAAERFGILSKEEKKRLLSQRAPIVLLRKKKPFLLSNEIAPENGYVGIMLPYTPLHFLLFYNPESNSFDFDALVMTSGNIAELPIIYLNEEALSRLSHLVDAFLVHNRDIHNRVDDSIVYFSDGDEILLRRSRGYVPEPILSGRSIDYSVLASGAELKCTFAVNRGNQIIISQHLGDMKNIDGMEFFKHTYSLITDIYRISPELAVIDKHPDYLNRRIVAELGFTELYEVQHHYAHICSVLFENRIEEPVIGFAFDGTGYGDDGAIWGSEVFLCDLRGYERVGHLAYTEMAGGDSASELCYIPAISYLAGAGIDIPDISAFRGVEEERIRLVMYSLKNRLNLHRSSSMGRLFDAVSFLCGLRNRNSFEGEAAMTLEFHSDKEIDKQYPVDLSADMEIEIGGLLNAILNDIRSGVPISVIGGGFHNWLSNVILEISSRLRKKTGINKVVLSGGVFQNKLLLNKTKNLLRHYDFEVFYNRIVPPNDGGISFGQIGHYIYSR